MGRVYFEKTWQFTCTAEVPYRYVCTNCGKEVTGKRPLSMGHHVKRTSGAPDRGLTLTEAEITVEGKKANEEVKRELDFFKKKYEKGDYYFLNQNGSLNAHYQNCPYCKARQKWSIRLYKIIVMFLVALISIPIVVFAVSQLIGGNVLSDSFGGIVIAGSMALVLGPACAIFGVKDLISYIRNRSLPDNKPEVCWDQTVFSQPKMKDVTP